MKNFIFLFSILLFAACGSSRNVPDKDRPLLSKLKNWPDSLVIETYYGGGMVNESSHSFISRDSCVQSGHHNTIHNHYTFMATQQELDSLLESLIQFNIDDLHIKKLDGIIYDAPSFGLTIRLGKKSISLSNGATETVDGKNKGDYDMCLDIISEFVSRHLASQNKKCCFQIDPSVNKSPGYFSLLSEDTPGSYNDSARLVKPEICFSLLPGDHAFQVHLTMQDKSGPMRYLASAYPVVKINDRDTVYHIMMKNDSTFIVR